MFPLLQSTAGQLIPVILKDSTGAVVTSVTSPTITRSKAGGALGALHDGTWGELAGGLYTVQLDATDTDTVGPLVVRVVKAGCVDSFVCCSVRATTEAAVKVSVGTGAGQINASSGKVAATIASGDAVGLPAAAAGAKGGLPILDASTGLVLTGYGPAPVTVAKAGDKMDLIDAPNATALTAIGTAVWATTTRTLSSFGTLVADVATAVWGATTRTLSAFGFGTPTGEGK